MVSGLKSKNMKIDFRVGLGFLFIIRQFSCEVFQEWEYFFENVERYVM